MHMHSILSIWRSSTAFSKLHGLTRPVTPNEIPLKTLISRRLCGKLVFACANAGTVDFDRLFECVIANLARLKAAESCSELVTQPQARV
jgi:hypothetical protein